VPSASTKALISGVICSSPWLRLAHPPPGVAFWLAPRLLRLFPKMPWYAPVNPAELSHDQAVIDDNKSDPLISPRVYLRAVVGPLLGGLKLLSDEYKNWPADLPILFTHGEDDPVTDCKASREMESKIEARDKECKTWKGAYHEVHNEEGEMKVGRIA
jgi:acylglycerol lipase